MSVRSNPDLSLGLFYQALSGRRAYLQRVDTSEPAMFPDTWAAVRLADHEDLEGVREGDKVALAHRAAHYREGTFEFSVDGVPGYFGPVALRRLDGVDRHDPENELEVFLRFFGRATLALRIFTALEDLRVDTRCKERLFGLRSRFAEVEAAELAGRTEAVGPRNEAMEALVRLSLGAGRIGVPVIIEEAMRRVVALANVMRRRGVNVHDSAVATMLAYEAIDRLPSMAPRDTPRVLIDVADCSLADPHDLRIGTVTSEVALEGDEVLHVEVAKVGFRDSLDARVWSYAQPHRMREAIFRIQATGSPEGTDVGHGHGHGHGHDHEADNRPKRKKQREPLPHEHIEVPPVDPAGRDALGALTRESARHYVYPEWDCVLDSYVPDACRVTELEPVTKIDGKEIRRSEVRGSVVRRARDLLAGMTPERTRYTPGHEDGDEIDIDAAIEAVIDRAAGLEPDPRVYLRQAAVDRDVAFGVLLDLSASTSDPVTTEEDAAKVAESRVRPKRPRVLDVQVDSAELLLTAMQMVGDSSLVMGYSGTGPDDVRVVLLKDTSESVDANVLRRLHQVKPIHMTRTGAAVRHAAARLARQPQTSKHLLVLTDGRPFDHDYGQRYGEENALVYATSDTRKALLEAEALGVNPVVIAIDKTGEDYLRDMCEGLAYHIVADASDLPRVLGSVYRGLSTEAAEAAGRSRSVGSHHEGDKK